MNSPKKRITLLCSSFPPETGAAPVRMFHLAKVLLQSNYEVTVICAMPNYPTGSIFPDYKGKIIVKENFHGINVIRAWLIPTNSSNKWKRALSLFSYTVSLYLLAGRQFRSSNPDLIIVSSPPFVTGYFGLRIAKRSKAKVILNVSDLWPQSAHDLGFIKEGRFYRFLQRLEQTMYRMADAFTVQSLTIKKHIEQSGNKQVSFVYRNLQPNSIEAKMSRPEGKRKIVYAGLLGIAQGVLGILEAIDFAALGTELHIYGQGFQQAKIIEWIDNHPERGICYMGSLPAESIPSMLSGYHAMLIPLSTSIHGAVPSKIFNAMANGLPVLFSGEGEAAEIVQSNKIGFVSSSGDTIQLSRNIAQLMMMPDEVYEAMRNNCIKCSEMIFNKERQDEDFLNFLASV
jgi:glycosyltransferase involved in cell wall biosynthesis